MFNKYITVDMYDVINDVILYVFNYISAYDCPKILKFKYIAQYDM